MVKNNVNDISVIIPMYNAENTIISLLEDLKIQNFKKVEYLIIDDGSTDHSQEKVKTFIQTTGDIRFKLFSQSNQGVSIARNLGIKYATGRYIIFIDSDDRLSSNFLTEYFKLISNTKADIAVFPINVSYIQNGIQKNRIINNYFLLKDECTAKDLATKIIEGYMGAYLYAYIFKRSLWKKVGFNKNVAYKEDFLALFNILKNNPNCKIATGDTAYYWYSENNGLTKSYSEKRINDGIYVENEILRINNDFIDYGTIIYSCMVADLEAINFGINNKNKYIYEKYSAEYLQLIKHAHFSNFKLKIKRIIQGIFLRTHIYKYIYKKMKRVKNESKI